MQLAEQINKKWAPVLDHPELPEIKDAHRRAVTALCLENVEQQYAQDQQGGGLLADYLEILFRVRQFFHSKLPLPFDVLRLRKLLLLLT